MFRSAVLKSYKLLKIGLPLQTCYVKKVRSTMHVTCSVDTWIDDPGGEYSLQDWDPDDVKRMKLRLKYYHHTRWELTREVCPSAPSSTDEVLQSTTDALRLFYMGRTGGPFSWACVKNSVYRGGEVYTPLPPSKHPPSPMGRHPPPRADSYCSGRYASYWNAFLFTDRSNVMDSH